MHKTTDGIGTGHASWHPRSSRGFVALIAVMLLATGTLAFSLVTMGAASSYADSVLAHELRIQARLNAEACLDSASLMLAKDFFLSGEVRLGEFGCDLTITNDQSGTIDIHVVADISGIKSYGSEKISIIGNSIVVDSIEIL